MCPGETPHQPSTEALEQRIRASADQADALRANYEDELEARDLLIVAALDAGWPLREVARWGRMSHTRVNQVVARRAAE